MAWHGTHTRINTHTRKNQQYTHTHNNKKSFNTHTHINTHTHTRTSKQYAQVCTKAHASTHAQNGFVREIGMSCVWGRLVAHEAVIADNLGVFFKLRGRCMPQPGLSEMGSKVPPSLCVCLLMCVCVDVCGLCIGKEGGTHVRGTSGCTLRT